MNRDRKQEHELEIEEELETSKENQVEEDNFLEALIYSLQNKDQELYQALEKEEYKTEEHNKLLEFIEEINEYVNNIEELGTYQQLYQHYTKNLQRYKELFKFDDMTLEDFQEYMSRTIPSMIINKGELVVEDGSLEMTFKKNRKVNVGEKIKLLSDYFKYTVELKDPYHITISTSLLKELSLTLILEDYYLPFELKEVTPEQFIYELELPYLEIKEYNYKLIAKDIRL